LRVPGDEEDLRLKDRLKIDPKNLEGCEVVILRDCLDQTVLEVEFPRGIELEWVDLLSVDGVLTWLNETMFVIDRERHYRVVGVVGQPNLNIQFRISGLNLSAWNHLCKVILDIIR